MLRRFNIALIVFISLLALLLGWRIFFYRQQPLVAEPIAVQEPVPSAEALSESALVLDLFNPSADALATQHSTSDLRRQIEEALVINFLLRHCELISSRDYGDTYRALTIYAQRSGLAPGSSAAETVQQISSAASATYSLIYARTDCGTPQLSRSASQMATWRKTLLKH